MRFVQNQGDAWTVTSAYLDRFVEEQRLLASGDAPARARSRRPICATCRRPDGASPRCTWRWPAATTIRRLRAGAGYSPADIEQWVVGSCRARRARVRRIEAATRQRRRNPSALLIDEMLAHARDAAGPPRRAASRPESQVLKIRHHGDFHLGQMLIAKDDIFIIDFEGEPRRTPRGAPAQGAGCPRRRRPDPLDRLFGDRGAGARAQGDPGRPGQARRRAESHWRDRATETFLGAYRETMDEPRLWPADPQAAEPPAELLPAGEGDSTRSNTNWRTGRTGCACR